MTTTATLKALRELAATPRRHDENALSADEKRTAVMGYMHYNGDDRWRLKDSQWKFCYLQHADGFGQITKAQAVEQCWDWSHIRDSSPAAIASIWETICFWHNRGRLKVAR